MTAATEVPNTFAAPVCALLDAAQASRVVLAAVHLVRFSPDVISPQKAGVNYLRLIYGVGIAFNVSVQSPPLFHHVIY